jgi:integrase
MLRHACGFALANKGHDTRALQAYLGHKNIQHTVATLSWRRIASMTSGAKVDPGLGSCRTVMAGRL